MNPYKIPKLLTMRDVDLNNKRVMIREDLNVPMAHDKISNDERIKRALPTIKLALQANARVMIVSHLGRPKEGEFDKKLSLEPVAEALAIALGTPVSLLSSWLDGDFDVEPGQVVLCENVRFNIGELSNDKKLAAQMASLCDVFVMDAFATAHRAQASTEGVIHCAPIACAGPLLMQELDAFSKALSKPKKPLAAIVAGSKVSSKLQVLNNLLSIVDTLIVGGGIANTLLKAQGVNIGQSLCEDDWLAKSRELIKKAAINNVNLPLPVDVVVADKVAKSATATTKALDQIDAHDRILDVGPQTVKNYAPLIGDAKTIVWNGPIGVFEFKQFSHGTHELAKMIADSGAYSIAGGGDTVAAVAEFGLASKINYISTGGGAFLEFLEGKPLPAVEALATRVD